MHVRLLGTAAGGGFPQWNCNCGNCRGVRKRKIYLHINNTNPMLIEDAPEQSAVQAAGVEVGWDGLAFTL